MKKLALVLLVSLLALNFGWASHSYAQGKVVRITLIDENGSGEDGSGQLTDQGDGTTKVELIMLNAPDGAVQPASIHKGTCTSLDADVAYPLGDVKESKSTTVVKATLADLTKEKYAINVSKSPSEAVAISCGNLPQTTASTGPLTVDQALTQLLDNANELLGNIKAKNVDASKNAYTIYHATFAANEDAIKAKDATLQANLEAPMNEVNDALNAGDWTKAEASTTEIIGVIKQAQQEMAGSSSTGSSTSNSEMSGILNDLKSAAADVQREVTNKDKDGAQNAYNDFHDKFAANEDTIKAKNADAQAHIEAAMHEVNDAITAGDWTKAGTASTELVNEVNDAISEANTNLPTSGDGTLPWMLLVMAGASLMLTLVGVTLRRRTNYTIR